MSATLMQIESVHAVLVAGRDTGLLQRLAAAPATSVNLARELGLDAVATERALEVLHAWGMVEREGGVFRCTSWFANELRGPEGLAGAGRIWAAMPNYLRTGSTLMGEGTANRDRAYPEVVPRLAAMFDQAARAFAVEVAARLPRGAVILDVGAGSAPWSLAVLDVRPDVTLRLLDLPQVCEATRAAATARGHGSRVDILAGDYMSAPLPVETLDLVIAANVLHLEGEERAAALVARLAPTLRAGGWLAVVDALAGDDEAGRRAHAAYALHLALRLPGGYPHLPATLARWMTAAGLIPREPTVLSRETMVLGVVWGQRPRDLYLGGD
ncbi:MAG: methyltransferase [Myxococcota bacterium]